MAKETLVRISSRVSSTQSKFIKTLAKKTGITEGQVLRTIIDTYIKNNK